MSSTRKFVLSLVILASLVGAALSVYLLMQPKTPDENKRSGAVMTIQGHVTCLPHKDKDGPQTLECATGLRTEDNKHYGLKNLPLKYSGGDKKLEVHGIFQAPAANNIYDIEGTLDVTEAKEL